MTQKSLAPRLVLASKSSGRLKTLRNAGVWPAVIISDVDESAVLEGLPAGGAPADVVTALGVAKAGAVAGSIMTAPFDESSPLLTSEDGTDPSALLVLGADSMLHLEGSLLGKPYTPNTARERIREMTGKDGTLWTGHGLLLLEREAGRWVQTGQASGATESTVHFGTMTDDEIDAYVATGEPLHVAGSFTIDGLGGPFVEGVTGDPHAVVGVSLPLVRKLAGQLGVGWPGLWKGNAQPQTPSV